VEVTLTGLAAGPTFNTQQADLYTLKSGEPAPYTSKYGCAQECVCGACAQESVRAPKLALDARERALRSGGTLCARKSQNA
jgi:hypothetical protein